MIKSRRVRWAEHLVRMKEKIVFKILTTGKKPIGRPWHRWEDNSRMDLKEICVNARNWVASV